MPLPAAGCRGADSHDTMCPPCAAAEEYCRLDASVPMCILGVTAAETAAASPERQQMDATQKLDELLAAYAFDELPAFTAAAESLRRHIDDGGALPAQLQSFADDIAFDVSRGPVARGILSAAWGAELRIDFAVCMVRDSGIVVHTGSKFNAPGDAGFGTVRADATADDIRRAVVRAFGESIESALMTFGQLKSWR